MAFSVRIGSALVTADTAAEAAELVRALGVLAAEPANEAVPPPITVPPPAALALAAIPAYEPPTKPGRKWPVSRGSIFQQGPTRFVLEISIAGRSDRRGSFKTREEAEAAQEETYQARLRGNALPIYISRRCRRCGVVGHTAAKCKAVAAPEKLDDLPATAPLAAPVVAPTPAKPERRLRGSHRPKPGSIAEIGDKFRLAISVDGKAVFGGMYSTRKEAETMQTRILDARLSGDPWPEIPRTIAQRVCRRCGEAGHDRRFCARPPLPPKEPRAPKAPVGGATRRGTPEYTAKLADAMRASWVRRRAARAATITCTENEVSVQAAPPSPSLPPAVVRAKLPPRCRRCFRVGHVDAECPKAARAAGGQLVANISPSVSDHSDAADSASMTRPDAASFEVEKQEQGDDDGADLTDLVDVPDAEPTILPPDGDEGAPSFNRDRLCGNCGKTGHVSVTCPTTSALPPERATHVRVPTIPVIPLHPCLEVQRPCPRTSCRFHLGPERPGVPLGDLSETCTLDVADRGGITLEQVGVVLGLTRERIRQIETKGLERAAKNARRLRIDFELPVTPGSNAPEDSL